MDSAAWQRMALWPVVLIAVLTILPIAGILLAAYLKVRKMRSDTQRSAELRKAVHLDNRDMFCYGMDTDVGNAFVYGELRAVDPVSVPALYGEYYCISRVEEEYVEKTRYVTESVYRNGQMETERKEETYYEWEEISTKRIHCRRVTFMDVEFPYEKIPLHPTAVVKSSTVGDRKCTWYAAPSVMQGTLYTWLGNHTIADRSRFFDGLSLEEALDRCLLKKSPYKGLFLFAAAIIGLFIILCLILCLIPVTMIRSF